MERFLRHCEENYEVIDEAILEKFLRLPRSLTFAYNDDLGIHAGMTSCYITIIIKHFKNNENFNNIACMYRSNIV
ncbi:MAG: hypothetical protein AB8U97_04830 [Rickettsia endosymbiont of Haemaphysalis japonica]